MTGPHLFVDQCGYDVEMEVADNVCVSLTVRQREGGPPVTLAGIRSLPVAKMAKAMCPRRRLSDADQVEAAAASLGGPSDQALRWVGIIYGLAVMNGDPPTKAVRETMHLSQSTAGRWVSLARKRGFFVQMSTDANPQVIA